jgi:hypothetical protein
MKQKLCTYTKRGSSKCTSFAMKGSDYCYRHNPDISEEDKLNASSKGGRKGSKPEFIETPLPEMKIEKMQDVVALLADTINNVRSGKISTKSGSTIGYLAFIMMMAMDKVNCEKELEEENKLRAEGKWKPDVVYPTKVYHYKDEFYLDKDGNPLIVENDGSYSYPQKVFMPENPDNTKQRHRKHAGKPMAPDKPQEKNTSNESNAEEPEEITDDTVSSDIPEEDNEEPDKFYAEGTAKIIKAVKESNLLKDDGET